MGSIGIIEVKSEINGFASSTWTITIQEPCLGHEVHVRACDILPERVRDALTKWLKGSEEQSQ